ncbi:hypothetical protein [Bernardetia sp.]|uniref:hypothetical protein n=1 Tax=Bernardetia sp. TaxID=1937974 RepID=UPI0025C129AA|nr:hypothetical protein [Bernardetia sp.]
MKKDIFFNVLVLVLGILFFAFQLTTEYTIYQMLQETLQKVAQKGDIQPSLVTKGIGQRTLFGIILIIISILTIRKSATFKIAGKIGVFMLFLGILLPWFFLAFAIFQIA